MFDMAVADGTEEQDLSGLSDIELEDGFGVLQRRMQALEAERLRWLAEIERRGVFRRDGHLSAQAWLASRHRVSFPEASQQVRTARALEEMPVAREALARGELSSSALGVLVGAQEASPDAFGQAEAVLVDAARALPTKELRSSVDRWKERVDAQPAVEQAERLRGRRCLEVSPVPSGMVRVQGELDPESGQWVITALRAVVDAGVKSGGSDPATPTQRRADGLAELCRQWLDRTGRPVVGGERPHLSVVVDLQTLREGSGRSELEDVGSVPSEVARRISCDASVRRIVLAGASEPLDVGRSTPVVPAAIRRAVVIRDRGCRFPGCDRPPSWSDAHHLRHWADGGETKVSNLILLCRPHHRLVHHGFGIRMEGGRPVFSRPDGTRLEERGPP